MKVLVTVHELMRLSKAVGDAKKSGDEHAIRAAEQALDAYVAIARQADGMLL